MEMKLMASIAHEMRDRGIDPAKFHPTQVTSSIAPSPSQIGPMLDDKFDSKGWDHKDIRWPASVNQKLFDGFERGLHVSRHHKK